MQTKITSHLFGSMASLALTAVLASSAVAQHTVPLKGSLQGNDSDQLLSPTSILVTSTGTGHSTLLGLFSFTLLSTVDLTQFTETGLAQFTAANGDSVFATVVGSAGPTDDPDVISISETYTITGGTGRFEGAQGTFTAARLGNGVTFTTVGTFNGTITPPGAIH